MSGTQIVLRVALVGALLLTVLLPAFLLIAPGYLPSWMADLRWHILVGVVLGATSFFGLLERFLIRRRFRERATRKQLVELADRDRKRCLRASLRDAVVLAKPVVLVVAVLSRLWSMNVLFRRLENLELYLIQDLHRKTRVDLRDWWRRGEQLDLRESVETIMSLTPPIETDRLLGRVLAANVLYLFGDLERGRSIADETMRDALLHDGAGLPTYQWLASYAYANSRLFLGHFEVAATFLGQLWRSKYAYLTQAQQKQLSSSLAGRSTLNPLAAVPRHIILASAFAGRAIRKDETEPRIGRKISSDDHWVTTWYRLGVKYSMITEKEDPERYISLHFTHGYMALYRLIVQGQDPSGVLEKIPDDAAQVSQYVKLVVSGLWKLREHDGTPENGAYRDFKEADILAAGNQFLHGIMLPAYAVSATALGHHSVASMLLATGREYAAPKESAFYDSLLDAAEATIIKDERPEHSSCLRRRTATSPAMLSGPLKEILGWTPDEIRQGR